MLVQREMVEKEFDPKNKKKAPPPSQRQRHVRARVRVVICDRKMMMGFSWQTYKKRSATDSQTHVKSNSAYNNQGRYNNDDDTYCF